MNTQWTSMGTWDIISLILTCVGSTILTIGFIPQAQKIYKRKHVTGLSIISWSQNLAGRLFFVIYLMLANAYQASPSLLFTIISQCLVAIMSIPLIYYLIRNRRTNGVYKKEDFKLWLFVGRMLILAIVLTVFVVSILASLQVFKIPVFDDKDARKIPLLIIGTISAIIVSSAFFAQSFKIFKTKMTKNNSLGLTVMFMIGNSLLALSFVALVIGTPEVWTTKIGPIIMIFLGVIVMGGVLVIKVRNIKNGIDDPATFTLVPTSLVKKGQAAKAAREKIQNLTIEDAVKTEKKD